MGACIYGLYGADGALRYIGKADDPAKRLASHMRDSRHRKTPLYAWIAKHGKPEMRVLEADCADWREAERRLIAEARMRGDRLLNLADGGDQPYCPPDVLRANGRKLKTHPAAVRVRSENGRKVAARMATDPWAYHVKEITRRLSTAFVAGELSPFAKACMAEAAIRNPRLFGKWADVA